MNGIIITNQEIGHNEYKIKRLIEEFNILKIKIDVFINDGTLSEINSDGIKINLPNADFIIYLDKDIYLAKQLEAKHYCLFNDSDFIRLCDDKNLTNIECAKHNIRMPKTITGPLNYSKNMCSKNLTFLNEIVNTLGLPLILKKVYGSLGMGVYLIKSKEELINIYKENCHEPLQFQEYIKSSFGRSVRVLIIDQKVVGGFIRENKEDFRSNFGKNATSKKIENGEKFFNFALKIANIFKIKYAGIDFLFDENDEPILCEINSNAFFEEFEKITSINVASLFAKMIIEKINNE